MIAANEPDNISLQRLYDDYTVNTFLEFMIHIYLADQSWNKATDSVTSSLRIKLDVSSGDKIKTEGMTQWKTSNELAEDSDVQIVSC